jgi:hypothetical protein
VEYYNRERTRGRKHYYEKTPMETFIASRIPVEEQTLDMMLAVRAVKSDGAHAVLGRECQIKS